MIKKSIFLLACFYILFFVTKSLAQKIHPPYLNPKLPTEQRVSDLLSRMTTEEKFWQLFMIPGDLSDGRERYRHGIFGLQVSTKSKGGNDAEQMLEYESSGSARTSAQKINEIQKYFVEKTRLKIPIIAFDEALHGLVREGATAFPQAIGLAATWDVDLMSEVSTAIAREVRSRGIRQILSPVVNIARDMRWGRVEETYGEDPYLSAQMAVAFVQSFAKMGVITTPKHFVANVGAGGRDSYPIHIDERLLREIYFPAFKACFQQGGAQSVMTAYNSLDGVPCSANQWLLRKILKKEWQFGGFVISDAGAVGGILDLHHIVRNREQSAKSAIEGGLDVIFQTAYQHHVPLLKAFRDRMIDQEAIDEAVSRVLRAKFRLGLFEKPYTDPSEAAKWNGKGEHRKLALRAAQKSIVLLKNKNHILPLRKNLKKIAVIGMDATEARLGGYSGPGNFKITILDGIKNKVGKNTEIQFAAGCGREDNQFVPIPQKYLYFRQNQPGLKGDYFNNIRLSGKPVLSRFDATIDFKWTLFPPSPQLSVDWFSVRWKGKLHLPGSGTFQIGVEGDDGFRLFLNGGLVIDRWQKQSFHRDILPLQLQAGKEYDLRLEFYETSGNSTIRLIWNVGVPDAEAKIKETVRLAGESDVAVVVAGIEEGEFRDRADLNLPGRQEEMIRKITATGTPVVVTLVGGSAITMTNWIDDVAAVLTVWYPGEAGGAAVADVLFGDVNPAGRLPVTFPQTVAQLPLYYNHKPTGRGDDYMDLSGEPLFPFGFGLSYTTFHYSDLQISPSQINQTGKTIVSCKIKNNGKLAGEEVVQLYIRDLVASVVRPVKELKGFKRIHLRPGEIKKVIFELGFEQLSMLDEKLQRVVEPGDFKIMLGRSAKDIRLRGFLRVAF